MDSAEVPVVVDNKVVPEPVVPEPWTEKQDAAFKSWLLKNFWSGPRWVRVRLTFELACGAYLAEGHPDKRPCTFEYYAQVKKTAFISGRFPKGIAFT